MLQSISDSDYSVPKASPLSHQPQRWPNNMLSLRQTHSWPSELPSANFETSKEVTQCTHTDEELRDSESNLRLLIEAIPGMVALSSAEGEFKYANERVLNYTGKALGDLTRRDWASVFHPDDVERLLDTWFQSIATGQPHNAEFRLRRWDGKYRWFQSRSEPVRDPKGRIIRWYSLINNIEDRKKTEETLRKTQVELAHVTRVMTMGELTTSIAHEVKQPLAAVITNGSACLRWLARESPDLDEARDAVRRVIRDGNRASDVITRIRALVQKTEVPNELLDINEAIADVVLVVQAEAVRKGVTIKLKLDRALSPVLGDRVQLQQVVLNLMMNGVEAMTSVSNRPRELVVYSCENESGQVLIGVQDCGAGIAPENLERIFEAFYTTKSQGMGMGLAISRSIIESHGGRLWAASNEGTGATFQFTLLPYQQTL